MANLKSSIKDIRRTSRRTKINNKNRATADKAARSTRTLVSSGKIKEAKEMLSHVYSSIDLMVKRKIITKNKAARQKSRLTKSVHAPTAKK